MTGLSDSFQRPINYLRISVTDRCNLRCIYCMPPEGIPLMKHAEILSLEEFSTVAEAAAELGITKIRITGGEPLVRLNLPRLISMLRDISGIDDISITTNGILLARYAEELKAVGLNRVNVSLDSLQAKKFNKITRLGELKDVLAGIEAAKKCGLEPVKINTVIMHGINDDELLDFARKTVSEGWNVRFIEMMPVTDNDKNLSRVMTIEEVKEKISVLGELEPCAIEKGNGPAKYYRLPHASGTIGFIAPPSNHICSRCNRIRLTADGKLRPCLLSDMEIDVKDALRQSKSSDEIKQLIKTAVKSKPARHQMVMYKNHHTRPFSQVGG